MNQGGILAIEMDPQDGTLTNHFGQIPRAQGTATLRTRRSAQDSGRDGRRILDAMMVVVYSSDVLALLETLDVLECVF